MREELKSGKKLKTRATRSNWTDKHTDVKIKEFTPPGFRPLLSWWRETRRQVDRQIERETEREK